jgi:hypothetical protein
MMFLSTILALLVLHQASARMSEPEHRRLSFERIAGYQPTSQVTDHAALDLDQQMMEQQLKAGKLITGRNVYEQGGHSYSFAEIKLVNTPSGANWPAGTQVFGLSESGQEVTGSLLVQVQWTPPANGQVYEVNSLVLYKTSDIQEVYVDCQVGGLFTFGAANRNGCKYSKSRRFALSFLSCLAFSDPLYLSLLLQALLPTVLLRSSFLAWLTPLRQPSTSTFTILARRT